MPERSCEKFRFSAREGPRIKDHSYTHIQEFLDEWRSLFLPTLCCFMTVLTRLVWCGSTPTLTSARDIATARPGSTEMLVGLQRGEMVRVTSLRGHKWLYSAGQVPGAEGP